MAVTAYSDKSRPYMGGLGHKLEVQTADLAGTLTEQDNGTVIFLKGATDGATITLPAVTLTGFHVKFVVGSLFATTDWVIDSAEGDNIDGIIEVAGAVVPAVAEDQVNFIASAESLGDWAEFVSDGTQWFVTGQAALAGGITVTDPS